MWSSTSSLFAETRRATPAHLPPPRAFHNFPAQDENDDEDDKDVFQDEASPPHNDKNEDGGHKHRRHLLLGTKHLLFGTIFLVLLLVLIVVLPIVLTQEDNNESSPTTSTQNNDNNNNDRVWKLLGQTIRGNTQWDNMVASSVSLSNDGRLVALVASDKTNLQSTSDVGLGGRARVYQLGEDDWDQVGEDVLLAFVSHASANTMHEEMLDCALSGNGAFLVVMASRFAQDGRQEGYARIYQRNPFVLLGWEGSGLLAFADAFVPTSVAISHEGTVVALGSPVSNQVRVYRLQRDNQWALVGKPLQHADVVELGTSVALSFNGLVLAATGWTELGYAQVCLYRLNDASSAACLHGTTQNIARDGVVAALSGDGNTVAMIGSTGSNQTTASVFEYRNNWEPKGTIRCQEPASVIGLSGNGLVVALAAPHQNLVRAYQYQDGAWMPRGDALQGDEHTDFFGSDLSLSQDGTVLAIGATQPNNNQVGYLQVYQWT